MNNPTPTTPNTTSAPNASTPKTDEKKNPSPQSNPQAIGGDQKESKTEVVKENKDIKAS